MAKTKYDFRKIAEGLVPFANKEDAVSKIKEKIASMNLGDHELIEFIKQCNVASQYRSYKKAGYKVNQSIDAVVVNPAHVFKEITKVNPTEIVRKTSNYFSNLKELVKDTSMAKKANLNSFEPEKDVTGNLIALVKLSHTEDKAFDAIKDIEKLAKIKYKSKRAELNKLTTKYEQYLKMFPYFRSKYSSMVDPKELHGFMSRIPTSKDIVDVNQIHAKIASALVELSRLNNIIDIIGGNYYG